MELTVGTIIKIILGLLVVAAVIYGLYMFFTNHVNDSFKNIGVNDIIIPVKFLLTLY